MPLPDTPAPSPLLLDRRYWQDRLSRMELVGRGLLILPRQDLTHAAADVVEWRMRAHDEARLWGLRAVNPFHPEVERVRIRAFDAAQLPGIDVEALVEGPAEFVYQVPAGRKLEDRVLDALRVVELAITTFELGIDAIELLSVSSGSGKGRLPDEFMIARQLIVDGLFGSELP